MCGVNQRSAPNRYGDGTRQDETEAAEEVGSVGRVTSADVAREAGVSRATVSFVLNQTPGQTIPDATRARVLEAAAALRYQPSAAARTLRRGRSDVVLFLMPDWSPGELIARTLDALSAAFSRQGLTLLVHPRSDANANVSSLWRTISPELVITPEYLAAEERAILDAAGIAYAELAHGGDFATMGTSQESIGRLQAEHLIGRGHHRIAYATTSDHSLQPFAQPRRLGVEQVCAEHGIPHPVVEAVTVGETPVALVQELRAAGVTAVAAYNDEIALAILAAARQARVRVPEDLAVVGADDITVARYAEPPLTTVRLDPGALVPSFVRSIMERIGRGVDLPAGPLEAAVLVTRESA